jgi:hypothetical protein
MFKKITAKSWKFGSVEIKHYNTHNTSRYHNGGHIGAGIIIYHDQLHLISFSFWFVFERMHDELFVSQAVLMK